MDYDSKILNILKHTSRITGVLSFGMDAFDTLTMVITFFDPDNPIVALNRKLHENSLYNAFQIGVNAAAVFTGGAYAGMQSRMQQGPPACFVAGTMILTAMGLFAIENIKAGDKVIATNPDTFETTEKTVVETYIREVPRLVHLTIRAGTIDTAVSLYIKLGKEKVDFFTLQRDIQGEKIWENHQSERQSLQL